MQSLGKKLELSFDEIFKLFLPKQGRINQWYGRIGSGKTYAATESILKDLRQGFIVYCNWKVQWNGYDERSSRWLLLLGCLGLKKYFYRYAKDNLHYLPIDNNFHKVLGNLTDCKVYLDEGHLAFDSYKMTKMDVSERANVLHTRHFDRTINIISQRPTAIHVTLRDNVNVFYKCEEVLHIWKLVIFKRTEFQDFNVYGQIDETLPIRSNLFFGRKKVFNAYDTKYLRGDMPRSQENYNEIYYLNWFERSKLLFSRKLKLN